MGKVITVRAIRLAAAGANLDALEWWGLDVLVALGGAVERVFQLRRARGMTKHPAVHTYLRNRMWVDAPPAKASGGGAPGSS